MKKYILHILFVFVAFVSKGQDTTYLDENKVKLSSSHQASYYKILLPVLSETYRISERIYTISGQLISYKEFNDYKRKIYDGKVKYWYENGQLSIEMDFKDGKLNGKLLTYSEDGKMLRDDSLRNSKLIEGKCFNLKGKRIEHFNALTMPEFPGGEDGLYKFLSQTITYPEKSRLNDIEGRVVVSFTVETNGTISDIRIE